MKIYQKNPRIMNIGSVFMFDHFKMGEQCKTSIWLYFKFKFEAHLQMTLHLTSFKWNCTHFVTKNITISILIMCLSIANKFIPCLIVCSIDVQPEPEATPFVEDPDIEPRQQGKQTPLIISIKSQFPSQSRLCMFRRSPRHVLSHS